MELFHKKSFLIPPIILTLLALFGILALKSFQSTKQIPQQPQITPTKIPEENVDGKFCGGIAGLPCPEGYTCQLEGDYPDAGGKCLKRNSTSINGCMVGGCNQEICADRETVSICIYRSEFACYKGAKCERQPDGSCGWTETPELKLCLENSQNSEVVF